MPFNFQTIVGVQVVLEKSANVQLVGELTMRDGEFYFIYDEDYLRLPKAIPVV